MRKHSKKFFVILLLIIGISSALYIYSAMKTAKAYSFFNPLEVFKTFENLPSVKTTVNYGKKNIDKVGEKIKNQTGVFKKLGSNAVSKTTDGLKNSAFGFVKENMNSSLNAIGGVLGVDEKLIVNTDVVGDTNIIDNKECK